jgi:hypothetical protein
MKTDQTSDTGNSNSIKLPGWLNHRLFGILISILFLFLLFHNLDLKQVWSSIKSFNLLYSIPAVLLYALSYIVRSLRWKELLSISKEIEFKSVIKALYIGYMANNLLPARMGELYRAHVIGTDQKITRSSALASIIAERVFDGLILFILLVILTFFFYKSPLLIEICITTGIIFLTGFVVIIAVSKIKNPEGTDLSRYLSIFPGYFKEKLSTIITSFIKGLGVIKSFKSLSFITITTIAAWALEWSTMYVIVDGFNIPNIKPLSVAFLVVLVAFSTMIPSGPAFIGPYQYAFVIALDLSNISKGTSIAIAVTTQVVMMLPVIIIGMILLWKNHFSLDDIRKEPELPEV